MVVELISRIKQGLMNILSFVELDSTKSPKNSCLSRYYYAVDKFAAFSPFNNSITVWLYFHVAVMCMSENKPRVVL